VKKDNMTVRLVQFIKFGLVGVSNVLISLLVYYLLIALRVHYIPASIAGYLISSLSGYFLNKMWVFKKSTASVKGSMVRYYIVYGSSLLINTLVMYLWVDLLNISDKLAPILTLCITVPYNYFLSKIWTFGE
jgi:putative flippase GtrA